MRSLMLPSGPTLVLAVVAGLLAIESSASAQGSGSSRLGQPGYRQPSPTYRQPAPAYRQPYARPQPVVPRTQTQEEYSLTLWRYLIRQPYTAWSTLPGKTGLRGSQAPHGAFVRLYANRVAVADPGALPAGSFLILEDYTEDRKTRTAVNILYRVKGYDPRNGDWYWMRYLPNGTLARTPPAQGNAPIAGRATSCIDCHRKAAGNDFVFSNDQAEAPSGTTEKKEEETKPESKAAEPRNDVEKKASRG